MLADRSHNAHGEYASASALANILHEAVDPSARKRHLRRAHGATPLARLGSSAPHGFARLLLNLEHRVHATPRKCIALETALVVELVVYHDALGRSAVDVEQDHAAYGLVEHEGRGGVEAHNVLETGLLALPPPRGLLRVARGEEALEFCLGHGLGEVIALHEMATEVLEHFRLLERLDALGDDGRIQPLEHPDDGTEHDAAALLVNRVPHEAHVELHDVHGHVLQHVQRGEPVSEIVHLHEHVVLPHLVYGAIEQVRLFHERALGHFQSQAPGWQVVFLAQLDEMLRHFVVDHLRARYVHRYGNGFPVGNVAPSSCATARLLPHEQVEHAHLAALFQDGHELARADPAQFGVVPPRERLGADDAAVGVINLRLIPNFDLSFGDRVVYRLLDNDAAAIALQVLLGEADEAALREGLRVLVGDGRVVHALAELRLFPVLGSQVIHARRDLEGQRYLQPARYLVDLAHHLVKTMLREIVIHMGIQEDEPVGAQAAYRQVAREMPPHGFGELAEHSVAHEVTVVRVYQAEVPNVHVAERNVLGRRFAHRAHETEREARRIQRTGSRVLGWRFARDVVMWATFRIRLNIGCNGNRPILICCLVQAFADSALGDGHTPHA